MNKEVTNDPVATVRSSAMSGSAATFPTGDAIFVLGNNPGGRALELPGDQALLP